MSIIISYVFSHAIFEGFFEVFLLTRVINVVGNYFKLNTNGLPQERYLTVFIKVEYKDGTVDIVDTGKIFKITR